MSIAAHGAAPGGRAAASNMPGLTLSRLGGAITYSHAASNVQKITPVLSHLIAGTAARIHQSHVEQPHFLSAS